MSILDRLFGLNSNKDSSGEPAPMEYKNEGASEKEKKKVRIFVTGHVQGVGFRYTTKQMADQIPVTGIVRNESDGSVYIEAVGTEKQVDSFIQKVRLSPSPSARVEKLVVEEDPTIEDYANFSVSN